MTNGSTVDLTAPVMSSAEVSTDGNTIVITYSEPVAGTLEASDWGVTLSTGAVTVTGATIGSGADNNKITLTLSSTIPTGVTVTDLVYTANNGTANSVKDQAATPNAAADQTLATVTNNSTAAADTTAPEMSSAAVSADGLSVVITYSEPLTGTAEAGDYAITVGGGYAGSISAATIGSGADANKVTLTMSAPIPQGAAVSNIVYTAANGTADSIKDKAAAPNAAADQTLATVTNSSKVIVGTSGNDTVNQVGADDVLYGLDGADTFTLLAGANPLTGLAQIGDYTVNLANEKIVFGGAAAVWTTAVDGWTITNGVATKSGATVSDFYTAFITATGAVGEVVAFVDNGNTYLFGEGASTDDNDNTAVVLVGVAATAVSTTAAADTVLIA